MACRKLQLQDYFWLIVPESENHVCISYDELGNLIRTGLDVNANGTLDLASTDRISEQETIFAQESGDWWQVKTSKVYAADNSDAITVTGIQKNRFSGFAGNVVAEAKSVDINGNVTTQTTAVDRNSKTVTTTVSNPTSSVAAQTVAVNGLKTSERTATNLTYAFSYDALGRQTGVTDPRTGTTATAYYSSGTGKIGQVHIVTDAASNVTTYDYASTTGRLLSVKDALNKYTYYAYNALGKVTKTWGDTDYPIEQTFDNFGQMTQLKTYKNGAGWNGSAWPEATAGDAELTQWTYNEATGLLTAKTYVDGKSKTYAYSVDGKLLTRTWARLNNGQPLVTAYSYDAATGQQTDIDYSDATPDIAFAYNRLGQQYQVTDVIGTRTFAYNSALQPLTETISGSYSKTLTRNYASSGIIGRYVGMNIGTEYAVNYGYDTYGRFNTITNDSDVYTYVYLANSNMVDTLTYPNNIKADYAYEAHRNLVTQIKNTYDTSTTISQYDYTNDAIGRRTAMAKSGTAFSASDTINYAYNDRSEVTAASATNDANYNFSFAFDNIGNRSVATNSGVSTSYTVNSLNQYTAITNPAQSPTYDNDGDMTSDGTWNFTWNAENRLVEATNLTNSTKLEFKYDYMGRRVEKKVYSGSTGDWTLSKHLKFVYNGYEQIEELDGADSDALLKKRIWGNGKILANIQKAAPSGSFIAYYALGDANKNITEYLDASGNIQAHYEYSPFGKITVKTGTMQNAFDYRFSSEVFDSETGLVYYNFRYYSPELGRWLSRDPTYERGGLNLYGMVDNNPVDYWDDLGLLSGTTPWNPDGLPDYPPGFRPNGVDSNDFTNDRTTMAVLQNGGLGLFNGSVGYNVTLAGVSIDVTYLSNGYNEPQKSDS